MQSSTTTTQRMMKTKQRRVARACARCVYARDQCAQPHQRVLRADDPFHALCGQESTRTHGASSSFTSPEPVISLQRERSRVRELCTHTYIEVIPSIHLPLSPYRVYVYELAKLRYESRCQYVVWCILVVATNEELVCAKIHARVLWKPTRYVGMWVNRGIANDIQII